MFGFLPQWPTILTLAMFPVLTFMYVKLARDEERDARAVFGEAYDSYAVEVSGFIPKLGRIFGEGSAGGYRHG
jgi:protein-S-isoprenylcysteine O-methyltransferase Ste14